MSDLIERTLSRLGQRLEGGLSSSSDEGYSRATAIWPRSASRPHAVVHCQSIRDVQLAILAARDCGLRLSVRGGGHDWAGRALCDGIVLDLGAMRDVVVGPDAVAAMGGGARAMDVAAEADRVGLAAVTGSVGAVGMAGLTLAGGYGPLIGRFGLALDNLVAAEVVLADGRVVLSGPDSEPDLFWALRGGGGNFGVVTAMWIRLHPVPRVRSGMLAYRFAEARAVLERCAEITAAAPDALTVQVGFISGPDGKPMVLVVPTWCGAEDEGERRIAPFLALGTLVGGAAETMSCATLLKAFDPYLADGRPVFMDSCWLPGLDGPAVDHAIEAMGCAAGPGCALFTHEFKGAASRVLEEATAFGLRRDHVLLEMLATFPDGSSALEERQHRQWLRDTRDAFRSKALPGGYPPFLAPDDRERASRSYGGNAGRLVKAKRRYDPDNVFRSAIPLPG